MTFGKLLLLILAVTGVVHLSAFAGDYVLDDVSVFESDKFDDFWAANWWSTTTRPLVRTLFALQIEFLGRSTTASHAINLLIHLSCVAGIACVLDLVLLHRFGNWSPSKRNLVVGAAALLWAVHPLTTTTVTYVIQRYESTAAMWMIWSLYCWLRAYTRSSLKEDGADCDESDSNATSRTRKTPLITWWIASLLLGLFAFASKESSAGLPLILLLFDRSVLGASWRDTVGRSLGLVLLTLPVLLGIVLKLPILFGERSLKSTVGFNMEGIGTFEYILSQPIVYLRYLKLLFFPSDLVLDYGWIPSDFASILSLGAIGWVVLIVFSVWCWRRCPLAGAAVVSALLVLAPTSFIPTQDIIFEHRFYLPSALIICALIVTAASMDWFNVNPRAVLVSVAVVALLLSFGTVMRNLDYVSRVQLLKVDLQRQPGNPRTVYQLATLENADDAERFEESLRRAIDMSKQRGYFYGGSDYKWRRELADLLYSQRRFDESRALYLETLPESHSATQEAEVLLSLAAIASIFGEVENANSLFEKAISLNSNIRDQIRQVYQQHRDRNGLGPQAGSG